MKLFGALLGAAWAKSSVTCNNSNDEVVMSAKVPVDDVQQDLSLLADWSLDSEDPPNYVAEWTSFTGTGFTIEQAERTKLSDSTKYQALVITKTIDSGSCTTAIVDGVTVCLKTGHELDFECAYDLSDQELDTVDFTVAGSDVEKTAVGEGTLTYTLEVNSGLKIGETALATITPKTAGLVWATVNSCTVEHDHDDDGTNDDSSVTLFESNTLPNPNPLSVVLGEVKGTSVLDFNWASFKWTTQKKAGEDVVETQHLKCSISLKLHDCKTGWQKFMIGGVPKCFKNFGVQSSSSAVSICTNADAVLPLPRSAQEQADYVNAFTAMGGSSMRVAIAPNDVAQEGTFVDQNNEPLQFTAWGGTEPNDGGIGSPNSENYSEMILNWDATQNWNDVPASWEHNIFCEN